VKESVSKYKSLAVVIAFFLVLGLGCLYADRINEQDRKVTEAAVLTGNGYTEVTMMDERGSCPRGIYARWYEATNPSGKRERGLVCIVYSNDVPYVIPTFTRG
jgi:hypothetical protein